MTELPEVNNNIAALPAITKAEEVAATNATTAEDITNVKKKSIKSVLKFKNSVESLKSVKSVKSIKNNDSATLEDSRKKGRAEKNLKQTKRKRATTALTPKNSEILSKKTSSFDVKKKKLMDAAAKKETSNIKANIAKEAVQQPEIEVKTPKKQRKDKDMLVSLMKEDTDISDREERVSIISKISHTSTASRTSRATNISKSLQTSRTARSFSSHKKFPINTKSSLSISRIKERMSISKPIQKHMWDSDSSRMISSSTDNFLEQRDQITEHPSLSSDGLSFFLEDFARDLAGTIIDEDDSDEIAEESAQTEINSLKYYEEMASVSEEPKPIEMLESNYFEKLLDIPSVNEFSEEPKNVLQTADDDELGHFFHPVSGRRLTIAENKEVLAKQKESYKEAETKLEVLEEKQETEELSEEQTDSEDDDLLAFVETDVIRPSLQMASAIDDEHAAYKQMLALQYQKREASLDLRLLKRQRDMQMKLAEETKAILSDIIDHVVEECELIDGKIAMAASLDNYKLMEELVGGMLQYIIKIETVRFMKSQIVSIFHRKRAFRAIVPHARVYRSAEHRRMNACLQKLNDALSKEKYIQEFLTENVQKYSTQLEQLKANTDGEIQRFEHLVRKVILHGYRDYVKLPSVIDRQLLLLSTIRNEIAEVRLHFIQSQHELAELRAQEKKLERIGHGVYLHRFMAVQTEIQTLEKKIEDRNSDLLKYNTRFNQVVHTKSHMSNKIGIIRKTTRSGETYLEMLTYKHKRLREKIYDVKLERNRMHNEMKSLIHKGGLMNMMTLCRDYDDTVGGMQEQRDKCENLRNTLADLEKKVKLLEKEKKLLESN